MMMARCPWYVAGPLVGVLIVGLRAAVNKPLGALGGYIDVMDHGVHPRRLGFSAFLLFGIVLGGALFAAITGTFSPTFVYASPGGDLTRGGQLVALLVAGVAMGIGARTAGGCTSGHGFSGMSHGSPASLVATMTFFATAVLLAHALVWVFGGAS